VVNLLSEFNLLTSIHSSQGPFNVRLVSILDRKDSKVGYWIVISSGWVLINIVNQVCYLLLGSCHLKVHTVVLLVHLAELKICSLEAAIHDLGFGAETLIENLSQEELGVFEGVHGERDYGEASPTLLPGLRWWESVCIDMPWDDQWSNFVTVIVSSGGLVVLSLAIGSLILFDDLMADGVGLVVVLGSHLNE
jgi:hypothetical protein